MSTIDWSWLLLAIGIDSFAIVGRTFALSYTVMLCKCCNILVIDTVAMEKVLDSPGVFLVLVLSSPESC